MVQALLARVPRLRLAVSATTRSRRNYEEGGVHYWFKTDDEFDDLVAGDAFLEWVRFPWGQRSGTLVTEVERITREHGVPLLELELEGSLRVKEKLPGAVTIFIDAPLSELERRLLERATESDGEIGERIALAQEQKELAGRFDFVVQNDDRERAADECVAIVERVLLTTSPNMHAFGGSGADGGTGRARTS